MPISGKEHQDLVARFENLLKPPGFTVRSPVREWDETGTQVAEFDVVIEGTVGDLSSRVLLECRDRPSDGPAPKSWIEQLIGRRAVHGFDRVWAVSTTGFSSPAQNTAREHDIGLKTVERLSSLSDQLAIRKLNLKIYQIELEGDQLSATTRDGRTLRLGVDCLVLEPGHASPQSIQAFLCARTMREDASLSRDHAKHFEGFNSLSQGEQWRRMEAFFLGVQSTAEALGASVGEVVINEPLTVVAGDEEWETCSLSCRASTRITNRNGTVALVRLYRQAGQEILAGETAFELALDERTWTVRVIEVSSGDLTLVLPEGWPYAVRITAYRDPMRHHG